MILYGENLFLINLNLKLIDVKALKEKLLIQKMRLKK